VIEQHEIDGEQISAVEQLADLLRNHPDGENITKKAVDKAGVGSLAELNDDQIERMIQWLKK